MAQYDIVNRMSASLAFISDFQELQSYVILGIRILLAIGAGLIGWYVTPPLVIIFHRLIYHKPASRMLLGVSRIIGTAAFGLLAFLLFSFLGFGGGGSGGFFGPGTGPGIGAGGKKDAQNGKQEKSPKDSDKQDQKTQPKETLTVEMILSANYKGDGKYYLIEKEEPPKKLEDVRELLAKNKGKWDRMNVIVYANSPSEKHEAVQELRELAQQHGLAWHVPPEYKSKVKGADLGNQ